MAEWETTQNSLPALKKKACMQANMVPTKRKAVAIPVILQVAGALAAFTHPNHLLQ